MLLYPRDLRERFGSEMELVFEQHIADAKTVFDAVRVWHSAVRDVVTVALPNVPAPIAVPALVQEPGIANERVANARR